MSLQDLMSTDFSDDDDSDADDSDEDFDPTAPTASGGQGSYGADGVYGVPYDTDDIDEDDEDAPEEDDEVNPNDEIRFSHEAFFSTRVKQLLDGSLQGGDPTSPTGLLTGLRPMLLHQTNSPHPERPARMVSIMNEICEQGLDKRCKLVPTRVATAEDLALVHARDLVDRATATYPTDEAATAALGLDSDTYFSASASGYAALMSAGSVTELTTRVAQGELRNALAVTRPPGHHCESHQAMGFCLLNNVCAAVAVARKRLGVGRVLVFDWDVHHGNGVQHIFESDPNVLYVSTHRYGGGFYPGTGHPSEVGTNEGAGTSVNVAWSGTGYSDREYLAAFDRLIMPIAREYGPELVVVSAGFDAALGDPLGEMGLTPAGYAHMTAQLSSLAGGKIVVALEGGYNLKAISRSAAACLSVLCGDAPPPLPHGPANPQALADIEAAVSTLAPYWTCLRPPQPTMGLEGGQAKRRRLAAIKKKRSRGPWWHRYF